MKDCFRSKGTNQNTIGLKRIENINLTYLFSEAYQGNSKNSHFLLYAVFFYLYFKKRYRYRRIMKPICELLEFSKVSSIQLEFT